MSNQVVKIMTEKIAACMRCPLCNKLYREATTISECLHTFCKKCIYKKLSDEEEECCPVCNTYLGCSPLEKLRSDHNKKDLREKVFPSKKSQGETSKVEPPAVETPTVEPPVVEMPAVETPEVLPARRKERSLSSLVVSTPRVSTKTPQTGRRSKVCTRRTLRSSSFSEKNIEKQEEDSSEDNSDSQNLVQSSSPVEPEKEREDSEEKSEGKANLWEPLTCLVEAANISKSTKFSAEESAKKSDLHKGVPSNSRPAPKTKGKELGQSSKVQDEKDATEPALVDTSKPKQRRNRRKKSAEASGESAVSPQAVLDGTADILRERKMPIWLSLVAYEDQEGSEPLPQISTGYLRIPDSDMPVSSLQKYLKFKLGLKSEDEVEIKCMGQPLIPTLQLNSLLELWLQTGAPTEKVQVNVGANGKEFVMVLTYGRKVPPINP